VIGSAPFLSGEEEESESTGQLFIRRLENVVASRCNLLSCDYATKAHGGVALSVANGATLTPFPDLLISSSVAEEVCHCCIATL
jgi:hypothetical protein